MAGTIYQSNEPPIRGSSFTFYISLVSQADTDIFKTTVTLAAGDVKVSKDGGAFANVATLPTEIGTSGVLSCPLSSAEMTADIITVKFCDAAGDEWQDAFIEIRTVTDQQDNIISAIWSATTRTLTSFGTLVADVATAVWASATRTLTSFGTLVADIWSYASRTLTQTLSAIISDVSGDDLTLIRGDTYSEDIIVGSVAGYISIWMTVKSNEAKDDSKAVFQIKKNSSGVGDGLIYANEEAASSSALASITVNNESTGNLTVFIDESLTDDFELDDDLYYDVQLRVTGSVTTIAEGTFKIVKDITRSIT